MTNHAHEAILGFCHAHGLDSQALDALTALVADLLAHEQARVAAAERPLHELRKTIVHMRQGGMELPSSLARESETWE